MLRRLRKPAVVVAAVSAAALLGLAGATAASAAPSHHAAVTHVAKPAQTYGVLTNAYGHAKYNSTAGVWRTASGTSTNVLIVDQGSYYTIQDENTGDWVAWSGPSANQVNETSNPSLLRAQWSRYFCNPGALWINNYAYSLNQDVSALAGPPVAGNLSMGTYLIPNSCFSGSETNWTFSGTL